MFDSPSDTEMPLPDSAASGDVTSGARHRTRAWASICVPVVFALLAFWLVARATSRWGVGVSADSVEYFSAARSFASGDGWKLADGTPMTIWPPMFPTLIGVGQWLGLGPAGWTRLLNAAAFAGLVLAVGLWCFRVYRSWGIAVIVTALVAISAALIDVSSMAWSEPVFTLLTFCSLVAMGAALQHRSRRLLVLAALLAGCAQLTRYAGIPLIGTSVVAIMIVPFIGSIRTRLGWSLLYGVCALAGPMLWGVHNRIVSSSPAPPGYESAVSLHDNVMLMFQTLGEWFVTRTDGVGAAHAVGVVLIAACLIAPLLLLREDVPRHFVPMVGFPIAYCLFLIAATSLFTANVPYVRYLTPAYPAFMCSIGLVMDRARPRSARAGVVVGAVAIAVGLVGIRQAQQNAIALVNLKEQRGAGFLSTNRWRTSPTLAYLHTSHLDGAIYSNYTDGVRHLARVDASWSPKDRPFKSSTSRIDELTPFVRKLRTRTTPTWLVWFNEGNRGIYIPPDQLQRAVHLTRLKHFRDGDVYRVTPQEEDASADS